MAPASEANNMTEVFVKHLAYDNRRYQYPYCNTVDDKSIGKLSPLTLDGIIQSPEFLPSLEAPADFESLDILT